MSPSDRVVQLYPHVPSSLFVAFYDSQGHGGNILAPSTRGTVGEWAYRIIIFKFKAVDFNLESIFYIEQ
jgi:hypothetical protein